LNCDQQEITAFGTGTRKRIPGLKDYTLTIEYNADWSTAGGEDICQFLWNKWGSTSFAFEVRQTSTATRSTTNPGFNGEVTLQDFSAVSGAVGDALTGTATMVAHTALNRYTSST
jgi:hypothetical protein